MYNGLKTQHWVRIEKILTELYYGRASTETTSRRLWQEVKGLTSDEVVDLVARVADGAAPSKLTRRL